MVSVLVNEGDTIQANQNVIELETDKATVEIPCPHAGRVVEVSRPAGQTVPIGTLLLSIEAAAAPAGARAGQPARRNSRRPPNSQLPPKASPARPKAPSRRPQARSTRRRRRGQPRCQSARLRKAAAPKPQPSQHGSRGGQRRSPASRRVAEAPAVTAPAGPATRRLARELGVDLRRVTGTGPGGRITEEDVKKAVRHSAAGARTGTPQSEHARRASRTGPLGTAFRSSR